MRKLTFLVFASLGMSLACEPGDPVDYATVRHGGGVAVSIERQLSKVSDPAITVFARSFSRSVVMNSSDIDGVSEVLKFDCPCFIRPGNNFSLMFNVVEVWGADLELKLPHGALYTVKTLRMEEDKYIGR